MKSPQGTIVAINRDAGGARAVVEVEIRAVCARCAAGRGCGAGILAGRSGFRRLDVTIGEDAGLSVGDIVSIELAPGNVLRAALIVYGMPLAGAMTGAVLAYISALGDGGAAALAIAGLVAGAMIGRRRLGQETCLDRFTPTVSRHARPGV